MTWTKKRIRYGSVLELQPFRGALLVLDSGSDGVTTFRFRCSADVEGRDWSNQAAASVVAIAPLVREWIGSRREASAGARLLVLDGRAAAGRTAGNTFAIGTHAAAEASSELGRAICAALEPLGVRVDATEVDAEQIEALRVTTEPFGLHMRRRRKEVIRLMIVDDSASVRALIRKMVTGLADIAVVAEASDPIEAEDLFAQARPDVMTLDLNMPRMDGITYLRKLVGRGFSGVLMITGAAAADSDRAIEALDLGAVDFLEKPHASAVKAFADALVERIRVASNVACASPPKKGGIVSMPVKEPIVRRIRTSSAVDPEAVVVIGASTGGTVALAELLTHLPSEMPPIVIVQHIPPVYSASFAARLNQACALSVAEASDGVKLQPGHVFVAPGDRHVVIKGHGRHLTLVLDDGEPVNRHKPSVDVLFESVSPALAARSVGMILTGMGADGARGLKYLRDHGGRTAAQNAETCVVFGMPREAIRLGGAQEVLPLPKMAEWLVSATRIKVGTKAV